MMGYTKLDWQWLGIEAQRRMAAQMLELYLDAERDPDDHAPLAKVEDRIAEQQRFLEVHTLRLKALERLYQVRGLTPPDFDALHASFAPPQPQAPEPAPEPRPDPAVPVFGQGPKKKKGRKKG